VLPLWPVLTGKKQEDWNGDRTKRTHRLTGLFSDKGWCIALKEWELQDMIRPPLKNRMSEKDLEVLEYQLLLKRPN